MPLRIMTILPESDLWSALIEHLIENKMESHALVNHQPKPATTYIGAVTGVRVIGHISIMEQALVAPATEWSQGKETPLTLHDETLRETFVQTFAVSESFRRQGIGRQLQQAALAETRAAGCWQLRSWSSIDRAENYQLKLSMGFSAHPAIYTLGDGREISGVYFVMRV